MTKKGEPMYDRQMENLARVCLIIGDEFTKIADAIKGISAIAAAKSIGFGTGSQYEEKISTLADLQQEFCEAVAMYELIELAQEPEDIPPPKKIPRPAKYLGPVNKANYTANRPPRRARSSCYIMKR